MPRIKVDDVESGQKTSKVVNASGDASTQDGKQTASPEKLAVQNAPDHSHEGDTPVDKELEAKSGSSSLSAFVAFPRGILFGEAEEGEGIILLLRAHIVTNVPWVLVTIVLVLVPIILLPLLSALGVLGGVGVGLIFVLTVFWYLGTFTYAFINFLYWYFNVYIVTNERVIDVDWYSVIYRKVSSTQIAKIQDASAVQSGVIAGIFDFGDVQIQTAGEEENFEFAAVPHPQLVAKKIEELMQKEEAQLEHEPGL